MPKAVTNVAWNILDPFIGKAQGQLQGVAQHVITEVAVSKTLRWLMKWENRSFFDLAIIHTVSQPFLGALFFGADIQGINQNPSNVQAATDGAKQTPAVLVAAYILASAQKGLHIPSFSLRDLGITVVSKALSRVVVNNVNSSMSPAMQQATAAHDNMVSKQKRNSRIAGPS